ncbi:MAG: hypothetical protein AAF598_05255, partial [Bacteroidota bacterium]
AFLDENGLPVTGEVTIKYREFHDMASVLASGITMADPNDPNRVMQSAGMFEIRGEQNGNSLQIAQDKSIEVSMGSYVSGSEYDFFLLDQENCNWKKQGTAEPVANENKTLGLEKLTDLPESPRKPRKANKDNFVFNLDVDYSNFPELKAFKNVVWEYAGNSPKTNPEKNAWVFQTDWTAAEIETLNPKKAKYKLILKRGEKTFETVVTPVLSEKDYQQELAKFNERNASYQQIKEEMIEERARLDQEADLLRSYSVNGFGIFNWDIWKRNGRVIVNASVNFDQDLDQDIHQVTIYLINDQEKTLVKYTPKNLDKFSFDPAQTNRMIAILPGNRVATFMPNDFEEINELARSGQLSDGDEYTFEMKTEADLVISSIEDIQQLLNELG